MKPDQHNSPPAEKRSSEEENDRRCEPDLLDDLVLHQPTPGAPPTPDLAPLVGECVAERHATLTGRARIRWTDGEHGGEAWLPRLHGLTVREGDRVLLQQPRNWPEPMVVGVVDGLAVRRKAEKVPGPTVPLRRDESLRIRTDDGQEIAELLLEEDGPVIRLLQDDVGLELPGELRIKAAAIKLEADRGNVEVKASDDVVVQGEEISLN